MAVADPSQVRMQYVFGLQAAAKLVQQLNNTLNNLEALYLGNGLTGTFTDADLAANSNTKHLLGTDIGTFTSNLNTITNAMTTTIIQNMAKAVGSPLP
jgi:hypothetical protein